MASNDWQQFLIQQGYSLSDDNRLVYENRPQNSQSSVYDLSALGALVCSGEEANDFLQSQLSNDISQLTAAGDMQLSAYCTPKGRMLALFTIIKRSDEAYFLIAPQTVIAKVTTRLQMFVMRAKVSFIEAQDTVILGIQLKKADPDSADVIKAFSHNLFSAIPKTQQRYLSILTSSEAIDACKALPTSCALADFLHWQTQDIIDGLPQLNIELVEQLIPQSINLDLVGGVNFKKGCYPGQEIIARIKYRGKPKTRMLTASIASRAEPQIGAPIFIDGKTQSAGLILNVGASQDGTTLVLITTPVSALKQGNHYLGAPDGEKFNRVSQAYCVIT